MEAGHPGFQPAVVVIHVVDMKGVIHHANAGTEIDWPVNEMDLFGKNAVNGTAVSAEYGVGVHKGF
jgi:hypothetical protein